MAHQDKQIRRKPVPIRLPNLPTYDNGDGQAFEQRTERTMLPRPNTSRNYTYSSPSNTEVPWVPARPGTPFPFVSRSQRPRYVPYRPGAVWCPESYSGSIANVLEQTRQAEDQLRAPLTADNVRWPFLDNDDDDEPTAEFPAVPLPEAPLRRRRAIRRGSSAYSGTSGRLPPTPIPTNEEHGRMSGPLSELSRDPLSTLERHQRRREIAQSDYAEMNQSWYPGDDEVLVVKNVLDAKRPRRQG
ncbi:uncharacterized protein F4807DRAFT_433926 [Annulohypoxylon truncatum]|uniref:uncharacterized protein n=1 Tax=Annulohypoxylon truncatum TaxID=327061 RepID=UPI002007B25F|nr:uncharacterized protein F4807DRAFT_433926 [Annulohypoxylon truncatum]KAI1207605.1 hypothetical protein F4807DRAFT_433926 [Annulohypoxylon truncatum]